MTAEKYDIIQQVVEDGERCYVTPPGIVIHKKTWKSGDKVKIICFVEIPLTRRKNILWFNSKLNLKEMNALKRTGKRSL